MGRSTSKGLPIGRWLPIVLVAGSLGCAANYYDSFKAAHPDAWLDVPPASGAGLHEVLAALYAPPRGRWQRSITKLDVIRLGGAQPVKLSEDEIARALEGADEGPLGVIAVQTCETTEGLQNYQGQKVAWFLLPDATLQAWDVFFYTDHCVVGNDFNPATRAQAPLEEQILAWRDANFPVSMAHTAQEYQHGIAHARKGRLEEARRNLARGDETLDVGAHGRGGGRREFNTRAEVTSRSEVDRLRAQLVRAIAAAEAGPSE